MLGLFKCIILSACGLTGTKARVVQNYCQLAHKMVVVGWRRFPPFVTLSFEANVKTNVK